MNEQLINEQYQYILRLIGQKRLKEALAQLEPLLWKCPDWSFRSRAEQIQTSYGYMLQYMQQGTEDPERNKLHLKLLTDTIEIADRVRIALLDATSTHYYHECRIRPTADLKPFAIGTVERMLESFNDDLAVSSLISESKVDEVLQRHEETQKSMFIQTWTNSAWSTEDIADAQTMLHSELLPVNDLCLFTSALTLSLMECFDLNKLFWLMDAYRSDDVQVSQRALIGLVFVLHIYAARLDLYPEIGNRLAQLVDDTSFRKDILRAHIQILLCRETEKIDKKMREEIIPEMLKNIPPMRNMKFGFEENDEEKDDANPDWASAIEQSGLGDKLREMNELQLEGADVYMSTFSLLKGYPFFQNVHNWFYPFDKQHSAIISEYRNKTKQNAGMLDMILQSGFFCNSDKYSLFLTMKQLPQSQRNLMFSQLTEQQAEEFAEKTTSDTLKKFSERPATVRTQYLQDLYRFFKLNNRRNEFRDLFKENIQLYDVPALKSILSDPSALFALADFHFRKQHWEKAAEQFMQITGAAETEQKAEICQKLGYSLQKLKQYGKAISAYLEADLIAPNNLWTNRQLAICYRADRQFKKALEYYRKVEEVEPENRKIMFYIGNCLAELGNFDEALNYFFKLDFLEVDCVKAWRAIGWCSFITSKLEQALKYYEKVIERKALPIDYLNAGHVAWSTGNIGKTVTYYSKAAELYGSRDQFLEVFHKDEDILISKGVIKTDISLVLDMI